MDLDVQKHICESDTAPVEKKAMLAEDHRVHIVLKKALREIEKEEKTIRSRNDE